MNQNEPLILFDGECNLCNGYINYILKRDRKGIFRFASLQSNAAKSQLTKFQLLQLNFDSIVLIDKGTYFLKSTAVLRISRYLPAPAKAFAVLLFIPRFIRDFFYDLVAHNRYRLLGKSDQCLVPTDEMKKRFIG